MKTIVSWVMKGRMQAVIAATVLALLGLLIAPLALLSAAVVVLAVLRQGGREGALVVVGALLAIAGLGGLLFQMPLATLLIGVMLWTPVALLAVVLGRSASLRLAIEAALSGALLLVLVQYLMLPDPTAFWADQLNEFLLRRLDPEVFTPEVAGALLQTMAGWMVGAVAATWLLFAVGALLLGRYWSSLLDRPGAFAAEFRALRFGRWLVMGLPVLLVVWILMSGGAPSFPGQLFLLGMVVFMLQGLSLGHGLVAMTEASVAWLVALYLILIFVAPHGATLVALAGYADGWLDFRARLRARRSRTGDS